MTLTKTQTTHYAKHCVTQYCHEHSDPLDLYCNMAKRLTQRTFSIPPLSRTPFFSSQFAHFMFLSYPPTPTKVRTHSLI